MESLKTRIVKRASKAVYRAKKKGLLKEPSICEWGGCMYEGLLEAHHEKGYQKGNVLDVVWLCPFHHKEIHRILRDWPGQDKHYKGLISKK